MSNKIYISYGHKFYDPNKFDEIKNRKFNDWLNKPEGGLWAADIKSDDWLQFCKDNYYDRHRYNKSNSFKFKLSDTAKILVLHTIKDCNKIIKKYKLKTKVGKREEITAFDKYILDYERIAKDFDVIDYQDAECQSKFPYWDIDCILVLNQEVIRPL